MNAIKLSIVVPCYNAEKYLVRCLDSLINQTLKDIEIVCVNDGSIDNTKKIILNYQKKYKNKIVLIDKTNEGPWKARYDGFKSAKGEFVGFLDSDDYFDLEFAEKMYNKAINETADIVVCGFERIDENTGKILSKEMCKKEDSVIFPQMEKGKLLEINAACWNKIYNKKLFDNVYDLKNKPFIMEDAILSQFLYTKSNKIVFINESLVNYIVRVNSIINTTNNERIQLTYDAMIEARNYCNSNTPDFLDYYDANAFVHLGVSYMYYLSNDSSIDFKNVIKNNKIFLDKNFPNWLSTKYTTLGYVLKNKGCNFKLWIVKITYKLHFFRFFILIYKFFIKTLKIDIKW